MNSQQILIETLTANESGLITESVENGKNMYLSGIFMQAEVKNRNNRTYPLSEITKAVNEADTRIKQSNGIFGELDHPNTLNINLERVSHVITELYMRGSDAIGRAKMLDTPMGLVGKELFKSGVLIGISSRGAGNVCESGNVSDFGFVTVDIVATPSAPGAIPASVYEALDMNQYGKRVLTLSEQVRNDPEAQKYLKKEILKFLNEGLFARR